MGDVLTLDLVALPRRPRRPASLARQLALLRVVGERRAVVVRAGACSPLHGALWHLEGALTRAVATRPLGRWQLDATGHAPLGPDEPAVLLTTGATPVAGDLASFALRCDGRRSLSLSAWRTMHDAADHAHAAAAHRAALLGDDRRGERLYVLRPLVSTGARDPFAGALTGVVEPHAQRRLSA